MADANSTSFDSGPLSFTTADDLQEVIEDIGSEILSTQGELAQKAEVSDIVHTTEEWAFNGTDLFKRSVRKRVITSPVDPNGVGLASGGTFTPRPGDVWIQVG